MADATTTLQNAVPGELRRTIRRLFVCAFVGVATVARIDKGSVAGAMLMAWLLLREAITLRMLAGAG